MQDRSDKTNRLIKKPKFAVNKPIDVAPSTNRTAKEPATDESTSETPSEASANISATSKSATSEPTISKSYIDNPNAVKDPKSSSAADLPTSVSVASVGK
jgi:hypothetical protein